MICPKCSQVIPDGSRFCTACGVELLENSVAKESYSDEENRDMSTEAQAAQQALGAAGMQSGEVETAGIAYEASATGAAGATGAAVKTGAGMSKPLLFGLIAGGAFLVVAAAVLIIVGVVIANKKTTINLADYTKVTFEGVDGYGTADLSVDEYKLATDALDALGIDVEDMENMEIDDLVNASGKSVKDLQRLYLAITSVDAYLDKSEGLSNGDTVTITYSFDEEKASDARIEFVGDIETRTVEGLEAVKEVDPFEKLSVEFGGTAPQAYVTINFNETEEPLNYIYFDYEPNSGLSNGDKVRVTAKGYDEESFIRDYGTKFTQTEKEYTVEGVDEYITSADDLDDDAIESMTNVTKDYITEYFADSSRKSAIKASDVEYYGYYFLANKNPSDAWYGYNKIYMVLSAKVSSKEKPKQFKTKTVYFPIEFTDIKKLADGTWDIESSYHYLLGSTSLKYGYWSTVSGYTDKDDMRSDFVDANAAGYDATGYDGLAD